jgi:hypothetical protein
MHALTASHAPEPRHLEPGLEAGGLVLTSRAGDSAGAGRRQWAARSTSHAVTCDYLVGRGFRQCSCCASRAAAL